MLRREYWRMSAIAAVLLTIPAVVAYDAVVFSSDRKVTKDYPTVENMVSTASTDSPIVFIVNPNFTLGQFSKEASAYSLVNDVSGLPAIVKSSSSFTDRHLGGVVHVPEAVTVASADDFVRNASVYVLVGKDWSSMQSLAEAVLQQLGPNYAAIITATDGVSTIKERVKRVVTSEMGVDTSNFEVKTAGGPDVNMPINLPPYNRSEYPDVKPSSAGLGSCMLYMEGVNIVVQNSKKVFATIPIRSHVENTSWNYANGDVQCTNSTTGNYTFIVRLKLKSDVTDAKHQIKISSGSEVIFRLIFTGNNAGYWSLHDVEAHNVVVDPVSQSGASFLSNRAKAEKKAISANSVANVGFTSVMGFAMACSDSQAAFFKTDQDGVLIGISLYNTEVQTVAVYPDPKTKQMYFTRHVEDCIGTFSTGSWMGIVSTLILLSGFIFGYLMLNSIQTMDRFDDPKHKQIVINVRE